jgi:DNA mismatch repair ATPase MutL
LPIVLDLGRREVEELAPRLEMLEKMGFALESHGPGQFTVHALPIWLQERTGEAFLREWLTLERPNSEALRVEFLAEIAARHLADSQLPETEEEVSDLLRHLLACDRPAAAPDGSRTYFELSTGEVQRRFSGFS